SVGEPRRTAYFATPPLPSDTAVHRRVIDVSPRSTTARSVTRLGLAGGFSGLVISTRAESGAHPAAAAVINTVPAARAMSLPIESTVAMDGLDDAHSTFAFRITAPCALRATACRVTESPILISPCGTVMATLPCETCELSIVALKSTELVRITRAC